MTLIKAIETTYSGCRFRSRLEARWAVFFDAMGITWQYEAQGYELSDRLYVIGTTDPIYYLPDFWLPDFNLHAEVKGSLTCHELARTLTLAAALSSGNGGCGGGHDLLILGPTPEPDRRSRYPYRLHMHKGDLMATPFWADQRLQAGPGCCHGVAQVVANDAGEILTIPEVILAGYADKVGDRWADGYRAARSARFEYGERG